MTPNREILTRMARQLRPLLDELVFVGGHVAELLVTDPAGLRVRATDDVDVIVAVTTRSEYQRLGERLRRIGFREDNSPGAPLCRWVTSEQLRLDVMPTGADVLSFTNPWYGDGVATAEPYALAHDLAIRIVTAPVFLATKWAAFASRGAGDYYGSHDVEDIVTVVAGRAELADELPRAPASVRAWLATSAREFLDSGYAEGVVSGALPDARYAPEIVGRVVARFEGIANA